MVLESMINQNLSGVQPMRTSHAQSGNVGCHLHRRNARSAFCSRHLKLESISPKMQRSGEDTKLRESQTAAFVGS